jgi:hypothetical protein
MGLEGVTWHRHFFPTQWARDDDRKDEVKYRFDACEVEGRFLVWSAERQTTVADYETAEAASAEAQRLADLEFELGDSL